MKKLISSQPTLPLGVLVAVLSLVLLGQTVRAQNTAVNYLGDLSGTSGPVTGSYDFKFRLFEKEFGSPQLGNTVFLYNVPVQNGSFAVSLDFGVVLLPITYFIEVSVKPSGPGDFVLLLPLQKFSPFATAQTADVANLATYANTSGSSTTSGYATNAGYANTSGTSGYATNAGYANTSGTATFATNSANSGYATNSGYANTSGTSGYATNSGYANTSGTSGYATNSGYANTSGTSVFATNAGYANTAGVAVLASNVAPNSVGTVALQDNSVTGSKIPPGTVVRSLNTLTDHVLLEPGPNVFISSSNQTITVSASAAVGGSGWGFSGNTIAGPDFLGTLNAQALEFRVNGLRALRLSPNSESHNVLGGHPTNAITNGAVGVVIAGGGNNDGAQVALGSYAVIGGGWNNSAAELAVVGGGFGNQATGSNSVVAGGSVNHAAGQGAVIGGGGRLAYGLSFPPFTYFPAEPNSAAGDYSVIAGGTSNLTAGAYAVIGGGQANTTSGDWAAIAGGQANVASRYSVVGGGFGNQAVGTNCVVAGGHLNVASGMGSVIGGGGFAGMGAPSTADEPNLIEGNYAVIGGGRSNFVFQANDAVIGGGRGNWVAGEGAVVAGGSQNQIPFGSHGVIGGGANNAVQANYAVVAGGQNNTASGDHALVAGGQNNTASGFGSFAAGMNATASHLNSFVWSDGQWPDGQTTNDYQFVVDAAGGLYLANDTGLTFGGGDRVLVEFPDGSGNLGVEADEVYFTTANSFAWRGEAAWPPGQDLMHLDNSGLRVNGTFVSSSDRNLKTNLQPVNPQEILARVAELPIARWSYQHNAGTTHLGPMAQDFHAAFGVGPDDRHISMVDADGVALAAIQGLNQKLQQKEAEITELRQQLAELKTLINQLAERH